MSRQLSAALAETLVARLQRRGSADAGQATRDLRVLLAAVLARLLPQPAGPDEPPPAGIRTGAAARGNRLQLAQRRLRERLETELDLAEREETRQALPDADIAQVDEDARSTLNSREAEIVRALRGCRLVVVPVDRDGPPTSFSVRMPARALVRTPPGRYASVARIRVGLLAASTHVDRVIEVLIPDGVRCVADGADAAAQARIEVLAPQQFEQLRLLLERMLRPDNPPHGWVRKQLAELAVVKLHAAIHCLRHHYETETEEGTERLLTALRVLREPLDAEAHGRSADLAAPWAVVRDLLPDRLLRRLDRSTTDPGSIRFRATAVEEFTLRSEPTEAYVELVVTAGDSPTLGTARAVNGINVLVLVGVAVLLGVAHSTNQSRADVLATLLTIFPTLQASRLEQPDSTRLAGLLTMRHFRVGLFTAVPGLALAGTLAFAPEGRLLLVAACVAVLLQIACHVWIRLLADDAASSRPRRPRVTLATVRSADHRTFDLLRSAWCRSLTGEVLLLGRTAYPFVAVDRDEPGGLVDLIAGAQGEMSEARGGLRKVWQDIRTAVPVPRDPDGEQRAPVNLLGVLRGTAVGRSATFLVFRDPPKPDWLSAATARDQAGQPVREIRAMAPDRARLAPMDPPDWVLDVMIGASDGEREFADDPLVRIARAAQRANYTLLNVQLPAPPPLQDPAERRWLRLRVAPRTGAGTRCASLCGSSPRWTRCGSKAAGAPAGGAADGVGGRDPDRPGGLVRRAARGQGADHRQDRDRPAGHRPRRAGGAGRAGGLLAAGRGLRAAAGRAARRRAVRAARARRRPRAGRRDLRRVRRDDGGLPALPAGRRTARPGGDPPGRGRDQGAPDRGPAARRGAAGAGRGC